MSSTSAPFQRPNRNTLMQLSPSPLRTPSCSGRPGHTCGTTRSSRRNDATAALRRRADLDWRMPDDRVVPTEVMVTSHESPASAGIGAGEKIILAADCDAAQGTFGRFVVESQATVVEASDEGRPASLNV